MSKPQREVIILEESVPKSLLKDTFTFVMFAGLMYFNHAVLSGSTLIDVIFLLIVVMWLAGRASGRVFKGTPEDAAKWLEARK